MAINNTKHSQQYVGFNTDERPKGDFYPSPPIAVKELLSKVDFGPRIWEPACGKGDISEVLGKHGHHVISSDLYDWGYGTANHNFLETDWRDLMNEPPDAIITNPPYGNPRGISEKFVLHALNQTEPKQGKVAFLHRLTFLEAICRKPLFTEQPFSKCLVFSYRLPRMNRYDFTGESSGSMMAFAWFVWDWRHEGPPTLEWF